MIPGPEHIHRQITKLTIDLTRLGLCDHQNFPALRDLGRGLREVGTGGESDVAHALKKIPYRDIYTELERTRSYNLRMLDGALIHMGYRFRDNCLEKHRLAFFPSPFLEEFQNNPDIYHQDEIYAEVIMRNIVPFPLRFDFDSQEEVFVEMDHPKSHLTLGQYKNCRIPVSAPLTPYHFIGFILRNFYNTAYRKYSAELSAFAHCFETSITDRERDLLYVRIPSR